MPQSRKPRDNMPAPTKAFCLRSRKKQTPANRLLKPSRMKIGQLDLQRIGGDLRTDDGPDHQKQHEEAEGGLPDREAEKTQAAPQEEDRRNGNAALLDHEHQTVRRRVREAEAQRQPEGIKQPGSRPDGEILPPGVAVEVEEKPHQNPHAQQGNHQCRPQVLLGEYQPHVLKITASLALLLAMPGLSLATDYPLTFKTLEAQQAASFNFGTPIYSMIQTGKPAGIVKAPPAISQHPLYGTIAAGRDQMLFRLDESKGTGQGYDRLIVDVNRNGDLTDDPVVSPAPPARGSAVISSPQQISLWADSGAGQP